MRKRLGAREPVAGGIAEAKMRIGVGKIGMRIGFPGFFNNTAGLAQTSAFRQQPAGQRRRRNERRLELDRLLHKTARRVAIAIL